MTGLLSRSHRLHCHVVAVTAIRSIAMPSPGCMLLFELSCICLRWHVLVSAAMYLPGLGCICLNFHVFSSTSMYLPQLPCISLGCDVFSSATIYLPQLPCACLSYHVFASVVIYLPQLSCVRLSCHVLATATMPSSDLPFSHLALDCHRPIKKTLDNGPLANNKAHTGLHAKLWRTASHTACRAFHWFSTTF